MRSAFFTVGRAPLCALSAAAMLLLGGCATPEHSNTLIFGTTTKFALDVSQDPTGALGVTLGYRRQEAVWMPLLPNQGKSGERAPADCRDRKDCPMFVAEDGADRDTYSVFASFGGSGAGGVGAAEAGAAQFLFQRADVVVAAVLVAAVAFGLVQGNVAIMGCAVGVGAVGCGLHGVCSCWEQIGRAAKPRP